MKKEEKTNVMRLLEQAGINYSYEEVSQAKDPTHGVDVAADLGIDPQQVYKTLVTQGRSKTHYVFMIPVAEHLNLKKAAKAVGEKKIQMIKEKELLPLTGYVHGGCSPIGMKKRLAVTLDQSASNYDQIVFNAGRVGTQLKLAVADLAKMVPLQLEDVVD